MSIIKDEIKPLSEKEVRIIANLEFQRKYYFTREDIGQYFDSRSRLDYTIHRLISKKRIISLNRNKYYLVPIKARTGKWADDSFIIVDEMFNGKDYYIGGWAAANFWHLTDQIPFHVEVYTNKREGKIKVLTTSIIFRKTTEKRIKEAVTQNIGEHDFKILGKEKSKEWLKKRR